MDDLDSLIEEDSFTDSQIDDLALPDPRLRDTIYGAQDFLGRRIGLDDLPFIPMENTLSFPKFGF